MKINKVGFIGFGLIGGTIAKKLLELNPETEIIAKAHSARTIEMAYTEGILSSKIPAELSEFGTCDLIFLCAPVENNIEYLKELKNIIKSDCIITDVGSTKRKIHEAACELNLEDNFIGGHPMTGSEKTGIENSNTALLENAYYVITPTKKTSQSNLDFMEQLIKSFGAIPLILDYSQHDKATAAISHLPHMIAFSLVHLVEDSDDESETMKKIAAGSFRDMTRVAASSPIMWENIASTNCNPILEMMDNYIEEFQKLRTNIACGNHDDILNYFTEAKDYRDSLHLPNAKNRNLVQEIYLDLNDESGQIAIIATILAFKNINIKNIGIINNREFEEGVLRIEFYNENDKNLAIELLKERNYTIHLR